MNTGFHALLPVRDEADVIAQSLRHMLSWADAVYVFDTGSVDETWEIVREIALTERRVVPLRKDPVLFSDTLVRGWLFHKARERMRDGDWVVRLDADEFHHVSPPEFVRTRMTRNETAAWHQYYDFRLTNSEVAAWNANGEPVGDRAMPIEERRRWYTMSDYSEPRLCRYRSTMQWPRTHSFPINAGYVARERIPIRHYPHRDPIQLRRRCRLRAIMIGNYSADWTDPESHHWSESDWTKFIAADDLPGLRYWEPGTDLPVSRSRGHLRNRHVRIAQRVLHAFLVRRVDKTRKIWSVNDYPPRISPELANVLWEQLGSRKE